MNFIEHLKKIEQIDQLIHMQATGSPKEFAAKLNISESTLFRLLRELKDTGCDIKFNPYRNTYLYRSSKRFQYKP